MIASSHQSANATLVAGIFLLCPRAYFNGINHSNLSSALFGLSGPIWNGISYIGESNPNHNLSNAKAYINGLIDDPDCLGLRTISFCHLIVSSK
ncbi:hypothetical protein KKH82_05985 [Patescibacteria group bacterium]|nr:hypothetical protein [Patescibacteria group bacterium]